MTATTISRPTPNLHMDKTHYGVAVSDIGIDDDGEGTVFALGHVEPRRALAAFMRHARTVWGDDLFYGNRPLLPRAFERVQHVWMVNIGTDEKWCLSETAERNPEAFPVTWWAA